MRLPTAALILFGAAQTAQAQEAWLSATAAHSPHAFFSSPVGAAGGLTLPLRGRFSFLVAYSLLDDSSSRFARACAGLIPPDPACPEEPIDDATSLRGFTLGLSTEIKRWSKTTVALVPTMTAVAIRSTGRGRQTGNSVDSSEPMIGFGVGAEIAYRPNVTWPLALHAGAQISLLGPLIDAVDGYSPFSEQLRLMRVDVGVSVGRRQRQ